MTSNQKHRTGLRRRGRRLALAAAVAAVAAVGSPAGGGLAPAQADPSEVSIDVHIGFGSSGGDTTGCRYIGGTSFLSGITETPRFTMLFPMTSQQSSNRVFGFCMTSDSTPDPARPGVTTGTGVVSGGGAGLVSGLQYVQDGEAPDPANPLVCFSYSVTDQPFSVATTAFNSTTQYVAGPIDLQLEVLTDTCSGGEVVEQFTVPVWLTAVNHWFVIGPNFSWSLSLSTTAPGV